MVIQQKEREISLRDLFITILQKWRILIVGALLGGVLFGVYGAISLEKESEIDYELLLTSDQRKNVEEIANEILVQENKKEEQQDYNKNSIFQNLDPFAINAIQMDYYVDNGYSLEYPVIYYADTIVPLVRAYVGVFSEEYAYLEISEKCGDNIPPEQYAELVFVDATYQANGYFSVKIYGDDIEKANIMADYLNTLVLEKTDEISKVYGEHDIALIEKKSAIVKDLEVYNLQQQNADRISVIDANIDAMMAGMTAEELLYLETLLPSSLEEKENSQEDAISLVKYALAGALITVFCVFVVFLLKYICNKTLHYAKELTEMYGVQVLGVFNTEKRSCQSKIDTWLTRLKFFGDENIIMNDCEDIVITKVKLIARQKAISNVVVLTEDFSEETDVYAKKVSEFFEKKLNVTTVNNLLKNSSSMENIANADAVVLIKSIGESSYKDIEKELQICALCDTDVIGAIVLN